MKERAESIEAILAKAEKFFAKGNYPLAKAEFEKALRMEKREDVAEKIEICKKELDKLKAKDLIKRAKKLLPKNSLPEAIRCYEEAYSLNGEDWIREKIEALKAELHGRDANKSARNAEAAGDFLEAASLYQQAFTLQNDEKLLLRKAHCLVAAGVFEEAVSILEAIRSSEPGAVYDYGFALARTERYYECLKVWENLSSGDARFPAQREAVRSRLIADLFERWSNAPDFAAIYEEGRYLLDSGDGRNVVPGLSALVEYGKYAQIEALWQQEDYVSIAGLLLPIPHEMDTALLALYAKSFFKVAETTGKYLAEFALFWLTAVHDRELSMSFAPNDEGRAKVRKELILRAETFLKRLAVSGNKDAQKELAWWKKDKKLIEDLDALIGNREDLGRMLCTPRFAEHFGRSAQVLELVRQNRRFFDDVKHYLATGSCYTAARESLYRLESGEYDTALAHLPGLKSDDEFTNYTILQVRYTCGLYYLEEGESNPVRFFESSAALFDIAPEYEEELAQRALDADGLDLTEMYENILAGIHRIRPSTRITEALSLVMSARGIMMYNRDKLNSRNLEIVLQKALKLYPGNEHARYSLGDTRVGLEIMELDKAVDRHKLAKAYRIASESGHREVRDYFFKIFGELVESLEMADLAKREKLLILDELRGWCAKLDESHPVVKQIDDLLEQIEAHRS